jgi:integrase/recombinase XerD
MREELIQHDPLQNVKPPKLPQLLPKVLSIEETDKLLKYLRRQNSPLGRRNYLITLTFLTTGLRANELCQLRIEDVHLDSQFILVQSGKGGKQRVVPLRPILSKQLWRYLRVWRNDLQPLCDNLFVSRFGLPLDPEGLERMCRRALSKIGARGGTHILRHTFATLCIQSRLYDLERLRLILGHADLSTTQRYLHLSTADLLVGSEPTPIARLGL